MQADQVVEEEINHEEFDDEVCIYMYVMIDHYLWLLFIYIL